MTLKGPTYLALSFILPGPEAGFLFLTSTKSPSLKVWCLAVESNASFLARSFLSFLLLTIWKASSWKRRIFWKYSLTFTDSESNGINGTGSLSLYLPKNRELGVYPVAVWTVLFRAFNTNGRHWDQYLLSDSFSAFLNNIDTAPHIVSVGLALGVWGGVEVLRTPSMRARCLIKLPSTFLPLSEWRAQGSPKAAMKWLISFLTT